MTPELGSAKIPEISFVVNIYDAYICINYMMLSCASLYVSIVLMENSLILVEMQTVCNFENIKIRQLFLALYSLSICDTHQYKISLVC